MNKKKLIALVLSGALVVGLVACGTGGADDPDEPAQQTAEQTITEETTAPAEQAEPQQTEQQEVAEDEEVEQVDTEPVGGEPADDVEAEEPEIVEPVVEVEAKPVEQVNTQPNGGSQQSNSSGGDYLDEMLKAMESVGGVTFVPFPEKQTEKSGKKRNDYMFCGVWQALRSEGRGQLSLEDSRGQPSQSGMGSHGIVERLYVRKDSSLCVASGLEMMQMDQLAF